MRARSLLCFGALTTSCAVYDPALLDASRRQDATAELADRVTLDSPDVVSNPPDVLLDDAGTDALDAPNDVIDEPADGGCRCAANERCCGASCIDVQSSPAHCGACDNACPGTTCSGGSCTATCRLGFGDCDGNATNGCESNLASSVQHCGRCGNECAFNNASATCEMGVCRIGPCDPGFADCDGNPANGCETNTNTSLAHCGACGMPCMISGMVAACSGGRCEPRGCPVGRGECDSNPMTVCETDTTSSVAHCSRCGNACAIPNSRNACVMSACVSMGCNPGFGNCDGNSANGCETDTTTSTAHCGGCGVPCVRANATPSCAMGTCTIGACNAGFGNCDASTLNGCETPLTSAVHCGRCGNSCAGSTCVLGVCDNLRVVSLTAGSSHTCARRNNGTLACWGAGADGRLGNGSTLARSTPVAVTSIADATQVSAGSSHTCARRAGQMSCWGLGSSYQLGNGSTASASTPVRAGSLTATLDIATGGGHSCAITMVLSSIRIAACWGDNTFGQVGNNGSVAPVTAPTATNPSFQDWAQVTAGLNHTCGRRASGATYCWGSNSSGQLGVNSVVNQRGPVQVTTAPSAAEITAGDAHTCLRTTTNLVYCWGSNSAGQLGDGTTTNRLVPTLVPGLTDATQISAGGTHTCARRATGAIVCWGSNADGQLGDGTTTMRLSPTAVTGLSTAVEVAAGGGHTCARRADHQVVCWGRNTSGQLGDGTGTPRLVPTLVTSLY
ncbi:MAG: hypothetical protein JNK05_36975 [Myxococcales bacterium]|nr:hypothetical protein [Myxococcales bacterium]